MASDGNRDKFISAYVELAKANGMVAINIPAKLFENINLPYFVANRMRGGVNDIYKATEHQFGTAKLVIDTQKNKELSSNLPIVMNTNIEDKIDNENLKEPEKNA